MFHRRKPGKIFLFGFFIAILAENQNTKTMMTISMIAAVAENNVIGKDNSLPWHLPTDLKYYKQTTLGHHIIMGRKNFEAIGRPLPKRTNIIITRKENYTAEGCIVVNSLREALQAVQNDEEPFIIGGGEIYKMALPYADRLYITRIHETFDGDVFFPDFDKQQWILKSREDHKADKKNPHDFSFLIYERKPGTKKV